MGQNLVEQLLETGKYDVFIFDVKEPPKEARVQAAHFIKGDLLQLDEVIAALKGMFGIVHSTSLALLMIYSSCRKLLV